MKSIIYEKSEISKHLDFLSSKLKTQKELVIQINNAKRQVFWHQELGFWYSHPISKNPQKKHYAQNWFGKTVKKKLNNIVVQINIPLFGPSPSVQGAFAKDLNEKVYLVRRGKLGNKNLSLLDNPAFSIYKETVQDAKKRKEVIIIGELYDSSLEFNISRFVDLVYTEYFEHQPNPKESITVTYLDRIFEGIEKTERNSIVKQRIGQNLLRKELIKIYNSQCAMCKVNHPSVLKTSHILPWAEFEEGRLDFSNTILLCGLHDLAFENGLIEIDSKYNILIKTDKKGLKDVLELITFHSLRLPDSKLYWPNKSYLQKKNEHANEN